MTLEMRLVHRDILDADGRGRAIDTMYLVDQQERVTMRQYLLNQLNVSGGDRIGHRGRLLDITAVLRRLRHH